MLAPSQDIHNGGETVMRVLHAMIPGYNDAVIIMSIINIHLSLIVIITVIVVLWKRDPLEQVSFRLAASISASDMMYSIVQLLAHCESFTNTLNETGLRTLYYFHMSSLFGVAFMTTCIIIHLQLTSLSNNRVLARKLSRWYELAAWTATFITAHPIFYICKTFQKLPHLKMIIIRDESNVKLGIAVWGIFLAVVICIVYNISVCVIVIIRMLPIWTRTQNGALTKLLGIKQDLNHPEPEEFCGDSFAPNTFTQDHPHGRYNYHRYHHQYYSLDLPENSRNKSPGGNKDVCSMDIQQSPYSPQRPPPRRLIPRDVKSKTHLHRSYYHDNSSDDDDDEGGCLPNISDKSPNNHNNTGAKAKPANISNFDGPTATSIASSRKNMPPPTPVTTITATTNKNIHGGNFSHINPFKISTDIKIRQIQLKRRGIRMAILRICLFPLLMIVEIIALPIYLTMPAPSIKFGQALILTPVITCTLNFFVFLIHPKLDPYWKLGRYRTRLFLVNLSTRYSSFWSSVVGVANNIVNTFSKRKPNSGLQAPPPSPAHLKIITPTETAAIPGGLSRHKLDNIIMTSNRSDSNSTNITRIDGNYQDDHYYKFTSNDTVTPTSTFYYEDTNNNNNNHSNGNEGSYSTTGLDSFSIIEVTSTKDNNYNNHSCEGYFNHHNYHDQRNISGDLQYYRLSVNQQLQPHLTPSQSRLNSTMTLMNHPYPHPSTMPSILQAQLPSSHAMPTNTSIYSSNYHPATVCVQTNSSGGGEEEDQDEDIQRNRYSYLSTAGTSTHAESFVAIGIRNFPVHSVSSFQSSKLLQPKSPKP